MSREKKVKINRRLFLGGAAAFTILPRHVIGGPGVIPPSEKLNMACVGVGGKGSSDVDGVSSENILALCDVHQSRGAGTFNRYPKAKRYADYRKMLEKEKGIDAVLVSTPDHMHAPIAMMAIKMGKHVYCQKPLTHTVYEARRLAQAAREHKVATQMGNQGESSEECRRICEHIWAGTIGKVTQVHVWTDRPSRGLFGEYWPQGVDRPKDTPKVPSDLDWDLWLGAAPERPYHPAYAPFKWRGWWDFGTGALGDIGCHALYPVYKALKLKVPETVQAVSTRVNLETYPLGSTVQYEFPSRENMPKLKLIWYDGGLRPSRPETLPPGARIGSGGTMYVGDKGIILNNTLYPESRRKTFKSPPKTLPRSIGHYKSWIQACKGGEPAGSNFDVAGPLTELVLLGNVALRMELREKLTTQKLKWDSKAFKFTNLDEANEFLHCSYRKGWTL